MWLIFPSGFTTPLAWEKSSNLTMATNFMFTLFSKESEKSKCNYPLHGGKVYELCTTLDQSEQTPEQPAVALCNTFQCILIGFGLVDSSSTAQRVY